MMRWIVGLVALELAGCASASPPPPAVVAATPATSSDQPRQTTQQPAASQSVSSQPSAQPPAQVKAIVVTGPGGEQRFTPDSKDMALALRGPLTLRAEVDGGGPRTTVEWYFEGTIAQGWGEVPPAAKGLRRLGDGTEVHYDLGPGTQGQLWVAVWGERSPSGRPGWRSWTIYPRIPLSSTTTCPPIHMPPPPTDPTHAWRDTVEDRESNTLTLNWLGYTFLVPLSADPSTCADPYVAAQLRAAQQH